MERAGIDLHARIVARPHSPGRLYLAVLLKHLDPPELLGEYLTHLERQASPQAAGFLACHCIVDCRARVGENALQRGGR